MEQYLTKILEWPVIVQGIIGSFLFWAIFTIGQKLIQVSSKKIKNDSELGSFFGKTARSSFFEKFYEISNFNFFICIYGALHYFLKFVIIVFISSLFEPFVPVFAYVGYAISFYFIFRAISYVTHFDRFVKEEKEEKLKAEKEMAQKKP